MMNNPASYLSQNPYGYATQGHMMPSGGFPDQFQIPNQLLQPHQQPQSGFPPHFSAVQNSPSQNTPQSKHPSLTQAIVLIFMKIVRNRNLRTSHSR